MFGQAGIGAEDAEGGQADAAATDVFVAVDAGVEGFFGVVEVPGFDPREAAMTGAVGIGVGGVGGEGVVDLVQRRLSGGERW